MGNTSFTDHGARAGDASAHEGSQPGGYAGSILRVDLSSRQWHVEPLDPHLAREYVGGSGLGARVYLDTIKQTGVAPDQIDPLSPENPFVLMTGPLTGMPLNAVARWTVGSRSPLTGLWGDANVGGYLGAELKAAGFDGIVITGAAERPTYLAVDEGTVSLLDATDYWGLDTYETEDALLAAHGPGGRVGPASDAGTRRTRQGHVLTIGPAGENLVRLACLVHHRGHVAGRTGLGAVWGAKRLKALFVRGHRRPRADDPAALSALRAELAQVYADSITVEGLRAFGTVSHMDVGVILGDIPMRNWRQAEWEEFDGLGPLLYAERLRAGNRSCYACGVRCKREAEVTEGPYRFARGPGPEYETVAAFGTMLLNPRIEAVGKANDLCNRLGLDTISCGATLAWATECRERGLLDDFPGDVPPLSWGDPDPALELVDQIARRRGLGAVLAEGSARAAAILGAGNDALTTVKGLESPLHDPRSAHGMGLAYAVSPRGACHMAGVEHWVEAGGMYIPEIAELAEEPEGMTSEGKADLNVAAQDFGTFFASCAGFCNLGAIALNASQAVAAVRHVTGFAYDLDEALQIGRRAWYLKRGLSNLFGARAVDDRLPARLLETFDEGPTAGSTPDMGLMLREFYEIRDLRPDGLPRRPALQTLGLTDLADLLGV